MCVEVPYQRRRRVALPIAEEPVYALFQFSRLQLSQDSCTQQALLIEKKRCGHLGSNLQVLHVNICRA